MNRRRKVMARDVRIDHGSGVISIDGIDLPWHVEGYGPTVSRIEDGPFHVVSIPLLVEGVITIDHGTGRQTVDPIFGDVGDYARTYVRQQLEEAFPWLR